MKKPDISIIMPAFNVGKYISEAIDSILEQKDVSFELVIINDGSTDSTQQIVDSYMKLYPDKIRCIKQSNKGLSYARKKGLEIAQGKYIYYCDGDDILEKDALSFMKKKFEAYNLDCLVVNARFKNELLNTFGIENDGKKVISKTYPNKITTGEEFLEMMIANREWRYAVWLYFTTKRQIIDNEVEFFRYIKHEDAPYNYQLLNSCKKVKFIDKVVYKYRIRANSLMSLPTSLRNIDGYINALRVIYNYNELKFPNDKNKYKYEIRMLDQLIDSYKKLPLYKRNKCPERMKPIYEILEKRDFYGNIDYKNIF